MTYYEEVRASEKKILTADICGCLCEVVEIDGCILLYADGYFQGEIYEEETVDEYIAQIQSILE